VAALQVDVLATCGPVLCTEWPARVNVDLVTLVVPDYDSAIEFFTERLGFELVEDSPANTRAGRPKRWVVVRPPGAETGLLLARADGQPETQAVGTQVAGRVAFFL
jgi:catechol 2,3-dioxygenase-like lactoylglutathione lyase family enzyme